MRSNKIDKAMHTLHASDDLYNRVLAESRERAEKGHGHGVPKPGRLALRSIPVVAAIGIAIAAMGGIAVSAVRTRSSSLRHSRHAATTDPAKSPGMPSEAQTIRKGSHASRNIA